MNRTSRTLIVVGVATIVAAVASFGVYAAVRSIPVREVEVAHTYIAVAARNIPNGTRLSEKDVKLVAWPSKSPVEGGFAKVEDVVNRGLVAPVYENEPLIERKLAPLEAGAGLPPSIPPGMRAMSVKVDEVIGVAGFVLPGTRVDVVVTIRRQTGNTAEEAMSRTVVSNVLVLTAGTKYDQDQAKEPQNSSVVTLAVNPADAERIALASAEGKISLALRNPLDVEPTETNGVRVSALMHGTAPAPAPAAPRPAAPRRAPVAAPAPVAPAPPPAPASSIYTVETIRGAKRSEEVVR
jgi:pilus assembly protein CpaB